MLIKENWFGDNNTDTDLIKDVKSLNIKKSTFNKQNYSNCITLECIYASLMLKSDKMLNAKYLAQALNILDDSTLITDYGIEFAIYDDEASKNNDKTNKRIQFAEDDIDTFIDIAVYMRLKMIDICTTANIVNVNIYFNLNKKSTVGTFGNFFIKLFRRLSCFFSGYDPSNHYFSCPSSSCKAILINDEQLFEDTRYQVLFSFSGDKPSKKLHSFMRLYFASGGTKNITERDIQILSNECHWDKVTQRLLGYMCKLSSIPHYLFDIKEVGDRNSIELEGYGHSLICVVKMSELYELLTPDQELPLNPSWHISCSPYDLSLRVDEFALDRDSATKVAKFYFAKNTTTNILIDGVTEQEFTNFIHTLTQDLDVQSIYIHDISDIDINKESEHTILLIDGDDDIPSTVKVKGYPYLDDNNVQWQQYEVKLKKQKKHIQSITLTEYDNTKKQKKSSKRTTK